MFQVIFQVTWVTMTRSPPLTVLTVVSTLICLALNAIIMNILSLENVSKNFGFKPLFENVSLGLEEGERVGIIGANGTGKTTLLRIIAGQEQPDTGRIVLSTGRSIGYLPQNPPFDSEQTVLDAVFEATNTKMQLLRDYETACHSLALPDLSEAAHTSLMERV